MFISHKGIQMFSSHLKSIFYCFDTLDIGNNSAGLLADVRHSKDDFLPQADLFQVYTRLL